MVAYWDEEWVEEWRDDHSSTCEAGSTASAPSRSASGVKSGEEASIQSFRHCRDLGRGVWRICSSTLFKVSWILEHIKTPRRDIPREERTSQNQFYRNVSFLSSPICPPGDLPPSRFRPNATEPVGIVKNTHDNPHDVIQ